MRRFFALLLVAAVALTASAQVSQAILVDMASFQPVKSDALSGINIDPIKNDSSRRPCARIKMRIERMSKQEIDGLELRLRTNNELTKCKTAEYDNGLIIELTAKAQTRFYLHHDKFGDSNEVILDLEGGCEYYIEAELNQHYSITVASNVSDADVYLSGEFKGKTNSDGYLIVEDMLAGEHTLRIIYAGSRYEQKIVVSSSNIFFKLDVDIAASKPQYLIIKTTPKSALVEINGTVVENSSEGASKLLQPGVFQYSVTAQNFHPKSGRGIMRGEQIVLDVELEPAFGYLAVLADKEYDGAQVYVDNSQRGVLPLTKSIVLMSGEHRVRIVKAMYKSQEMSVKITDGNTTNITPTLESNFSKVKLKSADNAEIWVDNVKKGSGEWQGRLESGDHLVECRKKSHNTASYTLTVHAGEDVERTFESLEPICGMVDITSTPIGATITIDGVEVGKTPLMKSDVLVGRRTIVISKEGYNSNTEVVDVVQGKVVSVKSSLSQRSENVSTTSTKSTTTPTKVATPKFPTNNIFQFGVGLEYGLGVKQMYIGVPIDLRIGRHDQLLNLFVTGRYNFGGTVLQEESNSGYKPDVSIDQLSVGGSLRVNILRSMGTDGNSVFVNLGAYYNFNMSASYKTGTISYNSSSYGNGMRDRTEYECDIINKTSLSALFAVGYGGKLMELSIYGLYDLQQTYNSDNLSKYIAVHDSNSSPKTLADYPDLVKALNGKINIGVNVRVFFGSGFLKK